MRTYLLLFLTVLCLQAAVAKPTEDQCADLNPFLREMVRLNKIAVVDEPVTVTSYCRSEWAEHGSCCQPQSAVHFAQVDSMHLTLITQAIAGAMSAQRKFLNKIRSDLKRWVEKSPLKAPEKTQIKQRFYSAIDSIGEVKQAVHSKCWVTEFGRLRSASLCSTCSGRSNIFFKDGKALVTRDTCTKMVKNCFPSINQIVNFIMAAEEFFTLLNYLGEKMKLDLGLMSKSSHLKKIFDALKKKQVTSSLKDYIKDQKKSDSQKSANALCLEFMALNKDPFIFQIVDLMIDLVKALYELKGTGNSAAF